MFSGVTVGRRAGATSIEVALVAPVVIVLFLGLIEIVSLIKCTKSLEGATSEAIQCAYLGGSPLAIDQRVDKSASDLPADSIIRLYQYRNYDASSQVWDAWQTLDPDGVINPAKPGGELRVRLSYEYSMISGRLFSVVTGAPGTDSVMLIAERTEERQ